MGDSTSDLGFWLSHTFTVAQDRVRELVPPAIASMVFMILGSFGMMAVMMVGLFAGILLGHGRADEDVAAMLGLYGSMFCVLPVFFAATGVLQHGLYRYLLAMVRGRPASPMLMIPSFGGAIGAMVITVTVMTAAFAGAMMCVIPGYILGGILMFASVAHADRDQGIVDAIAASYALTRPRLIPTILFNLVAAILITFVAYIPIVGWMLALPLYALAVTVAYLAASGELKPTPKPVAA